MHEEVLIDDGRERSSRDGIERSSIESRLSGVDRCSQLHGSEAVAAGKKPRVVCIASGPSLTREAVERCREEFVIVINDAWRLAPWANVLYACDGRWWNYHIGAVRDGFRGSLWTQDEKAAQEFEINRVIGRSEPGISFKDVIHFGMNSGFQALNLAIIWGAKEIILLGYDMKSNGKQHFFGDHPKGVDSPRPFNKFIDAYNFAAPMIEKAGINVINCSPDTALTCFKRQSLDCSI